MPTRTSSSDSPHPITGASNALLRPVKPSARSPKTPKGNDDSETSRKGPGTLTSESRQGRAKRYPAPHDPLQAAALLRRRRGAGHRHTQVAQKELDANFPYAFSFSEGATAPTPMQRQRPQRSEIRHDTTAAPRTRRSTSAVLSGSSPRGAHSIRRSSVRAPTRAPLVLRQARSSIANVGVWRRDDEQPEAQARVDDNCQEVSMTHLAAPEARSSSRQMSPHPNANVAPDKRAEAIAAPLARGFIEEYLGGVAPLPRHVELHLRQGVDPSHALSIPHVARRQSAARPARVTPRRIC